MSLPVMSREEYRATSDQQSRLIEVLISEVKMLKSEVRETRARHLTQSQKAALGVEVEPFFAEEAKARQIRKP